MLLAGCSSEVLDERYDGGTAFRISGEVSPSVEIPADADVTGAVLWAWASGEDRGAALHLVPTETRLFRYTMDIPPPPAPAGGDDEMPSGWSGLQDVDLLLGVPVLVAVNDAQLPTPPVDATSPQLFEWIGDGIEPGLAPIGMTTSHALVAIDADLAVERLGEAAIWSGHCALDEAVPGFTLYVRDHAGCGGWRPLGQPGDLDEFQGIAMHPPPPG